MSADRMKPVKLQVNIFAGTWKDVVRFDAADQANADQVMGAAATLALSSWQGRSKFRVAKDDSALPAEPLMEFIPGEGWKEVTNAW